MDPADAYERAHRRISSLVDDENADADVPSCPGWTVKDVIAHLAGFFTAYRSGDPKQAFSAEWGDREVNARRERSLQQCLTEWEELLGHPGDLFESHLAPVAVSDVLAHEQDIRIALNESGAKDDENIVPSTEMALAFLEQKAKNKGLPVLRIVTEDIDRKIGEGDPSATLRTSTFDLFRSLHGRRTVDQVRKMGWDGDPHPWMSDFFIFGPIEQTVEG